MCSGNNLADPKGWPEVVKAVAELSELTSLVDFNWSKHVLQRKKVVRDAAKTAQPVSAWSLKLQNEGLMRDSGMTVLACLLPHVAASLTELDLR